MNRLSLFLFVLLLNQIFTLSLCSQVPDKILYQVVVRDDRGELVVNHAVGIRIWILKNNDPITAVFIEMHQGQTNENGLVTLEIGGGTPFLGSFASIDWSDGPYFLQTDIDPVAGTELKVKSISQILSVPYAIYAKNAERLAGTIPETDPVFDASVAKGINMQDTSFWNRKPDHYSETDPVFRASTAYNIIVQDTASWNHKLSSESQNLAAVLSRGNDAGGMPLRNILNPDDPEDAVILAYVDLIEERLRILENTVNAGGAVTDVDGNLYNVVKIGNQLWMAENLKTTRYNDGQVIPYRFFNHYDSSVVKTPAYYWYNNDETFKDPYGALYTYAAVSTGKLCPAGWHVPDSTEWDMLTETLGGSEIAGGKMKEAGLNHWENPNTGADNSSGFTGLPGGILSGGAPHLAAEYGFMGHGGDWWSSTPADCSEDSWSKSGYSYWLYYADTKLFRTVPWGCSRIEILSVRCIKDKTE